MSGSVPSARSYHSMTFAGSQLVVFGGWAGFTGIGARPAVPAWRGHSACEMIVCGANRFLVSRSALPMIRNSRSLRNACSLLCTVLIVLFLEKQSIQYITNCKRFLSFSSSVSLVVHGANRFLVSRSGRASRRVASGLGLLSELESLHSEGLVCSQGTSTTSTPTTRRRASGPPPASYRGALRRRGRPWASRCWAAASTSSAAAPLTPQVGVLHRTCVRRGVCRASSPPVSTQHKSSQHKVSNDLYGLFHPPTTTLRPGFTLCRCGLVRRRLQNDLIQIAAPRDISAY
jgi:hypothetical protein